VRTKFWTNLTDLTFWATSGAKSDVIFLLSDPDFIYRQQNFAAILLNFLDPHFWLFWGFGLLLGYLATSSSKSDVGFLATPISYKGDKILRLSRLVIEIPIWGFWGYLATSGAKSDVMFLLSDPDFL